MAAEGHATRARQFASPAVRFSLWDGALALLTAAVEVGFAGTRRTAFGRAAVPVLTGLIALPVAIETAGYTRAAAISALGASGAILTAEAMGEFQGPAAG